MTTINREKLRRYLSKAEELLSPDERVVTVSEGISLLNQIDQAEARIQAVRDVLDQPADDTEGMDSISVHYANGYEIALQDIRRALDGDA